MNLYLIRFSILLSVILFHACALPKPVSFSDPDFIGRKYYKICVLADIGDIMERTAMEDDICRSIRFCSRCEVVQCYKVMPPTREWNDSVFDAQLANYKFDAVLKLSVTDRGVDEVQVPASSKTSTTETTKEVKGKEVVKVSTDTEHTDGYTKNIAWTKYILELYDVKTDRKVWMGTSNPFSTESMAREMENAGHI